MQQEWILEVSDVNSYVSRKLLDDPMLQHVRVRGELGSCKMGQNGYLYFNLKDANATMAGMMFPRDVQRLSFRPQDGMQVIVSGNIGLYQKLGRFQIQAEGIRPDGQGALHQ